MKSTIIRQFPILCVILLAFASCDSTVSRHAIPQVRPYGQNNTRQALEVLDRAIRSNPADPGNHYRKAQLLYEDGQAIFAQQAIEAALELNSTKPEYHFLLAKIARDQGDYTAAYREAITAETYRYPFPDLQGFIAELFAERGNFKEALTYVERALREERDARLMLVKARCLIGLSDTVRGIQWLAQAYRADTSYLPALDYLAAYYSGLEMNDTALYFVDKGLALDGDSPDRNMQKVSLLRRKGDDSQLPVLLKDLRTVTKIKDTVNHLLLDYYFVHYQYDSVNLITQDLLSADSTLVVPRLYKARVLDKRGFHWSAVGEYQQIIDQDSTQAIAIRELADLKRKIAYLRKREEEQRPSRNIISLPSRKN